ncbi:protein kinase domain-containing protein [Mycolicibacterium arseniciresistens]|uniref:non-specific serine/threonine protein kinase n=1 Tax=Mycolicibacterium arseniciresistens TaxID=3062257 RepID=A0ABT8U8Z6_9MYCO|nr:protein kinase [Mycolicibacterium arseniciresistens]
MEGRGLLGDRYELRGVLGYGGMAEVRDGWDTRLNRPVAVKILHSHLSAQPEIRDRFKIEACAAAALNHPHIVGVYDFGEGDETPFIVMERLPGDTLGDQIECGPLPQGQVSTVLRSVLSALAAAHGEGVLHRDIKPSNILLTEFGAVKVADFGIAKTPGAAHTTTGQLVGTLAYLSPERLAGEPASVADDLYAAGVVGYEALAGRKPFDQEDIAPLARAIVEEQPTPLAHLRPDLDPGLAQVVERAMSRDPGQRFASADAMLDALSGRAVPLPVTTIPQRPRVIPPIEPPVARPDPSLDTVVLASTGHRRSHNRSRQAVGAAAAMGALAIAVVAFTLDSPSTPVPAQPDPVSISTPNIAPISATVAPSPVIQPAPVAEQIPVVEQAPVIEQAPIVVPEPAPAPVIEQATQEQKRPKGNGNGRGIGNGNKKPK